MESIPQAVKFACDAVAYGWRIIPVNDNKIPAIKEWTTRQLPPSQLKKFRRFSHVCGEQLDGRWIIGPEFDHKPEQAIDATANYERFVARLSPETFEKLHITRSTSGTGYHIRAMVPRPIAGTVIRDDRGRKVGDLRSTGGHLMLQPEEKWLHGAPWTMAPLTESEQEELLRALNYREPVRATESLTIPPAEIRYWQDHIQEIIKNGLPHRFRATCQGAHLIRQQIPARRTSDARYALIEELVRHEYDPAQTFVLAVHFGDYGASTRKGLDWLETDVLRILNKVQANGTRVRRRGQRVHQETLPLAVPLGRPRKLTIEALMLYLRQCGAVGGDKVFLTQGELAEHFKVSKRTILRWEHEAAAAGLLARHTIPSRRLSYLVLTTSDKSGDTQVNTPVEDSSTAVIGGVWGGQDVSPPENSIPLPHLVEDAVDATRTVRPARKRARVVLAYVHAFDPEVEPTIVEHLLRYTLDWQRKQRQDAVFIAKLRALSDRQLAAKLKGLERRCADCHARGSPGQAWVFGRLAWFCRQEDERRIPLRAVMGRYDPRGEA